MKTKLKLGAVLMLAIFLTGCGRSMEANITDQCGRDFERIVFSNPSEKYLSPAEIGEELITKWLEFHVERRSCRRDWLSDFRVRNVQLLEENRKEMVVTVNFDVQAPDMELTGWIAGNGIAQNDNWIRRKFLFVTIDKDGSDYRIANLATSP